MATQAELEQMVREAYRTMDANSDGVICKGELANIMELIIGVPVPQKVIEVSVPIYICYWFVAGTYSQSRLTCLLCSFRTEYVHGVLPKISVTLRFATSFKTWDQKKTTSLQPEQQQKGS